MRTARTAAFTLIELLVVIAIIGILAGLTAVAVPRVLERSKIAQAQATANQIRTVLSTYYTDFGSYPPRYGYVFGRTQQGDTIFYLRPYLHQVGIYSIEGYEDPFSSGVDTAGPFGGPSQNPVGPPFAIGLLEFFPVGTQIPGAPGQRQYPDNLYLGPDNSAAGQDAQRQLQERNRSFVYIPVQQQQFDRVKAYYERPGQNAPAPEDRYFARVWDANDPRLAPLSTPQAYPPPRYDAFVLLSVGPGGETGGILCDPVGLTGGPTWDGQPEMLPALYHITGMRAYYLATRDLDGNGLKDFDFLARSRQNEAGNPDLQQFGPNVTLLPNGTNRYGPLIYSY